MIKLMSKYVFLTREEAVAAFGLDPNQFGVDLKNGLYDGTFIFTPSGDRRFKASLLNRRLEELCRADGEKAERLRLEGKPFPQAARNSKIAHAIHKL